jgi:penicillin amidase
MKPSEKKFVLAAGALLLAVAVAVAALGYSYLRLSLPKTSGTITVPGLTAPIEIVRDRNDIPHIYAKTMEDANFGLGFVHAQDRLWQMEFNRRVAAGRLSEIFGPSTLPTDRFLRTLGVYRLASSMVEKYDAETRAGLEAYAAGVNAYLQTRSGPLPLEFLMLGVTPEPWKPADSVAWLKMMAWDLGGNWSTEILRMRLAQKLSSQQIAEFLPPYPGDAPVPIRDLPQLYRSLSPDFVKTAAMVAAAAPPSLPEGAGSNNWVVAGSRSESGKPLLANDPHLGLNVPAIWYFAELALADQHVIGATLPGVPMVVLGRNDRIAWGYTNTGPDVQDLYLEKIDPDDAARYAAPAGSRLFDTYNETIRVKGQPDVELKVRASRHGPIISDVSRQAGAALPKGYALAFHWTALLDDDMTPEAGPKLARARNWKEFLEAVRLFHAPQQNMVYADVEGNIGFIAAGRVPIRSPENDLSGLAPAPGWDERYDWEGFIPFEKLPQSYNPANGRLLSANEKITPEGYKYYITDDWFPPYRSGRIAELLDAQPKHTRESFAAIQRDHRSEMARKLLPLMLKGVPAAAPSAGVAAMLAQWDGSMDIERPEPLIFFSWYRELTRLVYADELGPELFKDYWEMRSVFMFNVLSDTDGQSRWCDDVTTPAKETCATQIAAALESAVSSLKTAYGSDPAKWRWGDAHPAHSRHQPFTRNKWLSPVFDIFAPSVGDSYTVNVGVFHIADEEHPFENTHAASLRAIYDLADPDRSVFMHSTGQSGNRLSPWYSNFAEPWIRGEYVPMTTKRAEIDAGSIGTLSLLPGGK